MQDEIMVNIGKKLKETWRGEILERFKKGLIVYERQLQAELYFCLRNVLREEEGYNIWVEPTLNEEELSKVKPDLIITHGDSVKAIVELKFMPWNWSEPDSSDIQKMIKIEKTSCKEIILSYPPVYAEWEKQKEVYRSYQMDRGYLNVFFAVGNPKSTIFREKIAEKPQNFIFLKGWIDDKEKEKIVFEYDE